LDIVSLSSIIGTWNDTSVHGKNDDMNHAYIKNIFSEISFAAHFLYVTKPLIDHVDIQRQGSQRGLRHIVITEDVYNALSVSKEKIIKSITARDISRISSLLLSKNTRFMQ